jgi:ribosome-associated translation inhibitor RaiA
MRLHVQHLNLRSLDALDSWMEQQIRALGQRRQIDAAHVRLSRLVNASPAYQVNVHLVTPGPDVFAEGRDHTLRAAFAKVMTQLRHVLTSRVQKRLNRQKGAHSSRRGG